MERWHLGDAAIAELSDDDVFASVQPASPGAATALALVPALERSGSTSVSPRGARGIYQVMPHTAGALGYDPNALSDDNYAKNAATAYINQLAPQFHDDPEAVLVAYNGGPHRAQQWVQNGKDLSVLKPETQHYVKRARQMMAQNNAGKTFSDADVFGTPQPQQQAPQTFSDADVFGAPPQAQQQPQQSHIGSQIIPGLTEGALGLAGQAEQIATSNIPGIAAGAAGMFGVKPQDVPLTPEWVTAQAEQGLGKFGLNPASVPANTWQERLTRDISSMVPMTVVPEAGIEASATNVLRGIAQGVGSGVGQFLSEEWTPDRYKQAAGTLGALAGGIGTGMVTGIRSPERTPSVAAGKTSVAPPPDGAPPPGTSVGHTLSDGSVVPVTVKGYVLDANGQHRTIIEHADRRIEPVMTQDFLAGMKPAPGPPGAGAEVPEEPYIEGQPLTQQESEALMGGRKVAPPGRKFPQEPELYPTAVHALDEADRIEKMLLTPEGQKIPEETRNNMWAKVANLRAWYGAENLGPETRTHPLAGDPAAGAGELAVAAKKNPALYGGERIVPPPPPPGTRYVDAIDDVKFARGPAPKDQTVLDAIKSLGGIALKTASGKVSSEMSDIRNIFKDLSGSKLKRGLFKEDGLTPDYMRGALQERGWFVDQPTQGDDMQEFMDYLHRSAMGENIVHPNSEMREEIARHAQINEDMGRAGIKRTDSHRDAATKLADWRKAELARQAYEPGTGFEDAAESTQGLFPGVGEEEAPQQRRARVGRQTIQESQQLPRAVPKKAQLPANEGLFAPPAPATGDLLRPEPAAPVWPYNTDSSEISTVHEMDPVPPEHAGKTVDLTDEVQGLHGATATETAVNIAKYLIERGRVAKTESGILFSPGKNKILSATTSGDDSRVRMPLLTTPEVFDPNENIVMHHNHPNSSMNSDPDIGVLAIPGLKGVFSHGHNGNWHFTELTPQVHQSVVYDTFPKDMFHPDMDVRETRAAAIQQALRDYVLSPARTYLYAGTIADQLRKVMNDAALDPDVRKQFNERYNYALQAIHAQAAEKAGLTKISNSAVIDPELIDPRAVREAVDKVAEYMARQADWTKLNRDTTWVGRTKDSIHYGPKETSVRRMAYQPAGGTSYPEGVARFLARFEQPTQQPDSGVPEETGTPHAASPVGPKGQLKLLSAPDVTLASEEGVPEEQGEEYRRNYAEEAAAREAPGGQRPQGPPATEDSERLAAEAAGAGGRGGINNVVTDALDKERRNKIVNPIERYYIFPRVLATLHREFGAYYNAFLNKQMEASNRIAQAKAMIPTFLGLSPESQAKIYGIAEYNRLNNTKIPDDGRPISAYNDKFPNARVIPQGHIAELTTPEEIKGYRELQNMFQSYWSGIQEGWARRLGWKGPWSDDSAVNRVNIQNARASAMDASARKSMDRILLGFDAFERKRQQTYIPFQRNGMYEVRVTQKPGPGQDALGGGEKTVWYDMAEPGPMAPFVNFNGKGTPGFAKDMVADAQKRFPGPDYRITPKWKVSKEAPKDIDLNDLDDLFDEMQRGTIRDMMARGMTKQQATDQFGRTHANVIDAFMDRLVDKMTSDIRKRSYDIAGYTGDFSRATGSYMYTAAHHIADLIHRDNIEDAYSATQGLPDSEAGVKRYAAKHKADVEGRGDGFMDKVVSGLQKLGFAYTMAGNPSTMAMFMLHTPQLSVPRASMGIGFSKVLRQMAPTTARAMALTRFDPARGLYTDISKLGRTPEEAAILQRAKNDGLLGQELGSELDVRPEEAREPLGARPEIGGAQKAGRIMATADKWAASTIGFIDSANRASLLLSFYRAMKNPGDLLRSDAFWNGATGSRLWHAQAVQSGARGIIDAYRNAVASGDLAAVARTGAKLPMAAEQMARFMTKEAGGDYGRLNTPEFSRNFVGRAVMFLHGFTTRYLSSTMGMLWRHGPEGRAAVAKLAPFALALVGVEGMPFTQDAENLYDWVVKSLTGGKDPMTTYRLRAVLANNLGLGKTGAEMVMRGPVGEGLGIDLTGRIGLGDFFTRAFSSESSTPLTALTVPAGHVVDAIKRWRTGQGFWAGFNELGPNDARNFFRALIARQHGYQSPGGKRPLIGPAQIPIQDTIKQILGFRPLAQERAYENLDYGMRARVAHERAPPNVIPRP